MDRKLGISLLILILLVGITTIGVMVADLDISLTVVVLMIGTLGLFYWMQDDLTFFG